MWKFNPFTAKLDYYESGSAGSVDSVVAGTDIAVDATDPANPIVSSTVDIAGHVVGPASSTDGNFALFDGITGKLIKDGGSAVAAFDGGTFSDVYTTTLNFDAGAF
jgi:hypothetical protein